MLNKLKGVLQVCAVKAPGYGDRRKAMLEDLATLTKGKAVFKDLGIQLESIQLSDLGRAKKVKIDAENTTITEGSGDGFDCARTRPGTNNIAIRGIASTGEPSCR